MGILGALKVDWAKSKAAWNDSRAKATENAEARRRKDASRRSLNIVGESFKNSNGISRQAEIKRCSEGEPVALRAEPNNKFSDKAIAVYSHRGVQIGYIGEDHTEWVSKPMENPEFEAQIEWVTGGVPDKPSRGIVLSIGPC